MTAEHRLPSETLERRTYSAKESFALLGMPNSTGFDLIRRGDFPVRVIRAGRRYYIPKADLDALLSKQGQAA